jgi:uncharacterized protein
MGSKIRLDDENSELAQSFYDCIEDLADTEMVQRLAEYRHHMDISRLQHCLNVAYYSYLLAEKLGFDSRAAARGGLLHDLFFYDYKTSGFRRHHKYIHPRQALENARTLCELTGKEEEIILNHMWPSCTETPRHIETYIVSSVDKYCATFEAVNFMLRKVSGRAGKTINR